MDPVDRARELLPFFTRWGGVILAPLAALLVSVLVFQLAWRRGRPPDDPDLHWTERARQAWAGRILLWRAGAVCFVGSVTAAMMVAGPVPVVGPFGLAAGAGVGVWLLFRAYSVRHRRRWLIWLDGRTARRGAWGGILTLWLTLLPTFVGLIALPEQPGPFFFALLAPLLLVFGVGACGGGVFVARRLGLARAAPPEIREAVEEAARAGGGKPPRVFLVELGFANAYALPLLNTVAVSERAAEILTLPEIRAVAAHEVSHLNEPRRVTVMRVLGLTLLLVVMGTRPLTAHVGPGGFLLLLALAFLLRLRTIRMSRRLESVADDHAHGGESGQQERVYAAALQKLYRDNLTPAVLGRKIQTHPELYDRLVAVGETPDYPRPAPPPRPARAMVPSVLLAVAVPVLLVILQSGTSVRRPGTEAEALRAIALTGGSARLLADLGRFRLEAGDTSAAATFYSAAEWLAPRLQFGDDSMRSR